jgi:hypothetical protein
MLDVVPGGGPPPAEAGDVILLPTIDSRQAEA